MFPTGRREPRGRGDRRRSDPPKADIPPPPKPKGGTEGRGRGLLEEAVEGHLDTTLLALGRTPLHQDGTLVAPPDQRWLA